MASTGPIVTGARWVVSVLSGAGLLERIGDYVWDALNGNEVEIPAWRMTAVWSRNTEDEMATTFDFLFVTDGEVDSSPGAARFEEVEDLFITWYQGSLRGAYNPDTQLSRLLWHRNTVGSDAPQPLVRTRTVALAGTNASGGALEVSLPPQVAICMTERTPVRKHWGRFYLPATVVQTLDHHGVMSAIYQAAFVDGLQDFYRAAGALDSHPCVVSHTLGTVMGIETVSIDRSFDTIRRRKADSFGRANRPLAVG